MPNYNCYYYAKEVDYASRISIPSKLATYEIGCEPVCLSCISNHFNNINNTNNINNNLPQKFSISNYPNPFNPVTKIKYEIPNLGNKNFIKVQIKVYDLLGKEVAILVNENKQAGTYEIEFNGNKFVSGIYLYKIEAGDFIEVRKMVLIK